MRSVKITSKGNVHEKCGTLVEVEGMDIAIFKRNDVYYAIGNVCSHQHFSMLHQGKIDGMTVECPMHGWTYDMRTGKAIVGDGKVPTYTVKVVGDDVYIDLPE